MRVDPESMALRTFARREPARSRRTPAQTAAFLAEATAAADQALMNLSVTLPERPAGTYKLDLAAHKCKQNGDRGYSTCSNAVDNRALASELRNWHACRHFTSGWWGIDLGTSVTIAKVKLHNRNDGHSPERLQGVSIWLGDSFESYDANTEVASGLDVPMSTPLDAEINAAGRYLWVQRSGDLTLCEIEVWQDAAAVPAGEHQVTGLQNYGGHSATPAQFPVHIVKEGRMQSHVEMKGLRIARDGVADGRVAGDFKVVVWPRCVTFSATFSGAVAFSAALGIQVAGDDASLTTATAARTNPEAGGGLTEAGTNMKCPHSDTYRLFRSEGKTVETCHNQCLDTADCALFSFGDDTTSYSGVCMGCVAGSPIDGLDGFNVYNVGEDTRRVATVSLQYCVDDETGRLAQVDASEQLFGGASSLPVPESLVVSRLCAETRGVSRTGMQSNGVVRADRASDINLETRGPAECNTYTGCGTGAHLARLQIQIANTAEAVRYGASNGGAGLVIEGDNGQRFPIHGVCHFAWRTNLFFFVSRAAQDLESCRADLLYRWPGFSQCFSLF